MSSPGRLRRVESTSGAWVVVDGQPVLSFGGSGYLGLGGNLEIIEAGVKALRSYGVHSQLPRSAGYGQVANLDAEEAARQFFEVDGAMFFATGYMFGLIGVCGLAPSCGAVFLDESAHYSLRDACLASGMPVHEFRHGDAADLALVIARELGDAGRPLVVTDGMFPTWGAIAPLKAYADVLAPRDGWLVVDESHAFGCVGPRGRGAVELAGIARDRVLAGGSMAKATAATAGSRSAPPR